jgi:hypothetical protein
MTAKVLAGLCRGKTTPLLDDWPELWWTIRPGRGSQKSSSHSCPSEVDEKKVTSRCHRRRYRDPDEGKLSNELEKRILDHHLPGAVIYISDGANNANREPG